MGETFKWPLPSGVSRTGNETCQTVTITNYRVEAKLPSLPKLPPAVLARLQADMARRIEEMAYATLTGGFVPEREQTVLDVRKYREMFPDGSKPRRLWGGVVDLDAVTT